jgi:hypothetical protein
LLLLLIVERCLSAGEQFLLDDTVDQQFHFSGFLDYTLVIVVLLCTCHTKRINDSLLLPNFDLEARHTLSSFKIAALQHNPIECFLHIYQISDSLRRHNRLSSTIAERV